MFTAAVSEVRKLLDNGTMSYTGGVAVLLQVPALLPVQQAAGTPLAVQLLFGKYPL